jgi:DNA-directed RNA polymerase
MPYSGGYFLFSEPLVRGYGPNAHTARDLSNISNYALDAVNAIQETPWQINRYILDVVNRMVAEGKNVGFEKRGVFNPVLVLEHPVSPKDNPLSSVNLRFPDHVWTTFTPEQKKKCNQHKAKEHTEYEEAMGTYQATSRLINIANEMSQFEKFYFPHNMDFRTRIYPIPTDLNPQANDLSKGFLRFSRGTRLGPNGVFWMGFTVASHWGEDKLAPAERYEFAKEMLEHGLIQQWVDDPMINRGWLEADAPFQFLAVAAEWVWAHRLPDPETYVSHLPGNLDGSCNGAQHLSIMARDLVGATATNCTTSDVRNDLYMEVADRVFERVKTDAAMGNSEALSWLPKLIEPSDRRVVVKRSVMTVPFFNSWWN